MHFPSFLSFSFNHLLSPFLLNFFLGPFIINLHVGGDECAVHCICFIVFCKQHVTNYICFGSLVENTMSSSVSGGAINLSVPIVLPVTTEAKQELDGSAAIALEYQGSRVAILRNPEFYQSRKEERCARQWGTTCPQHPYIKVIKHSSNVFNTHTRYNFNVYHMIALQTVRSSGTIRVFLSLC